MTAEDFQPMDLPLARSEASARRPGILEVVDSLLRTPGAVTGEEADLLLDFRSMLRRRTEAEAAIRLFCELRRRLERRHYLAFFRLRSWLERNLTAEVRLCPAAAPMTAPVKLQFFCPEAIRRAALCSALGSNTALLAPRIRFGFRDPSPVREGAGAIN